ncbi:calcium/sodium antiporter [Belliella sp. DSM 111904]|uniref:Calcium/sodium antiporter n=1 Tax=Belliella filtrata TaxID=2923435 RepID=A0ABS9UXC0_9BACT|nr:calcium/sodium antiporter [Belliella filtrata]MCH7408794.1 calcium/sodium antiporter [Belliella filtrata]
MVYIILVSGLIILLVGGKFLVDGASSVALKFGLSPGLIGLTVVAFGTSAPELLVSINAAIKGTSDIAIGNVVGSNIANISLVLGISTILYPIILPKSVLKLDYLFALIATLLFYLISLNLEISRIEGIILTVLLVVINIYIYQKLKGVDQIEEITDQKPKNGIMSIGLLVLGVVGLYFGSDMFVDSAVEISRVFGVSERVIGVTVIAIGTSLPELTTSVIAAINKKTDIAIGNILGSNMMNVFGIIGITAIVQPIPVSDVFLKQDYLWMIGLTLLLFPILKTKLKVSRIEGGILLLAYMIYMITIL